MILMEWIQEAIREGQIIDIELESDNIIYTDVPNIDTVIRFLNELNAPVSIAGITKQMIGKHETRPFLKRGDYY